MTKPRVLITDTPAQAAEKLGIPLSTPFHIGMRLVMQALGYEDKTIWVMHRHRLFPWRWKVGRLIRRQSWSYGYNPDFYDYWWKWLPKDEATAKLVQCAIEGKVVEFPKK